jgi:hypothetical protein
MLACRRPTIRWIFLAAKRRSMAGSTSSSNKAATSATRFKCKDYVRSKAGLPAFKPNVGGRRRASSAEIAAMLTAAVSAAE